MSEETQGLSCLFLEQSPFKDGDIVKVTFESRPTIRDISFKDYATLTRQKEDLGLEKTKISLYMTTKSLT